MTIGSRCEWRVSGDVQSPAGAAGSTHPVAMNSSRPGLRPAVARLAGCLLVLTTALVMLQEWTDAPVLQAMNPLLVILVIGLFSTHASHSGRMFISLAGLLTLATIRFDEHWQTSLQLGFGTAAIIAAFFSALNTLRNAASTSSAVSRSGDFLARQPPGRRYAALTLGCQAYSLLLNYGAISLLGNLATASARQEPDEWVRQIRVRRMLLAIQRGFVATLPWSPLSFCVIITTTVVPGTSWALGLWPCLVSGLIIAGLGWLMDSLLKPRPGQTASRPTTPAQDSWTSLLPLTGLLFVLGLLTGSLHWISGLRIAAVVIIIVPVVALTWIGWQNRGRQPARAACLRARSYAMQELPGYHGELTLLMMAGYIGTLGGHLLAPVLGASGLDLTALPPLLLLVSLVWLIPLSGQLGMNPILTISLIAPLLPDAATLGLDPIALMVAMTAGWSMSSACSPFTVSTLLIGSFAGVSARRVGLRWNGLYTLLGACVLSAWVALFGWLSALTA